MVITVVVFGERRDVFDGKVEVHTIHTKARGFFKISSKIAPSPASLSQ